jgi:sortase A
MSATSLPGNQGNSVIVGHRDTYFQTLKKLNRQDIIQVQTLKSLAQYRVRHLSIVHQNQTEVLLSDEQGLLTLITCYPFDSALINPEMRFVVQAEKI